MFKYSASRKQKQWNIESMACATSMEARVVGGS